jgi:hypothetical protein
MSSLCRHSRYTSVRESLIARWATVLAVLLLSGCAVKLRPEYQIPKPLLQPMDARVGLVLDETLRSYTHEETRAGGNWKIELGPGHEKLFRSMFGASFDSLQVFEGLDAARGADGLQVIFEPGIEEYSFVSSQETSGHWAVTISYRIAVLDPSGAPVDTFTLTGYGSSQGEHGSEASLTVATGAAMRDAAAKFLVQMPRQALAKKLTSGEAISQADRAVVNVDVVEMVPIDPVPGS